MGDWRDIDVDGDKHGVWVRFFPKNQDATYKAVWLTKKERKLLIRLLKEVGDVV